jgi:exosome complex RNA-binding protein Csl4
MAAKKKLPKFELGDTVRLSKSEVGVISNIGLEEEYNESTGTFESTGKVNAMYVQVVDQSGESDERYVYPITRVKKVKIEYVVVWTDGYSDPFTQFETRAEADKFAAKKRKQSDVVDVRVYKLTK